MKPLRFWTFFAAACGVGGLGFCRAAAAQPAVDPRPSVVILGPVVPVPPGLASQWPCWPAPKGASEQVLVKTGAPSQVLIRIGQPYRAVWIVWISRWDTRKPRH